MYYLDEYLISQVNADLKLTLKKEHEVECLRTTLDFKNSVLLIYFVYRFLHGEEIVIWKRIIP